VRVLVARAERFASLTRATHRHTVRARAAAFRPDGRHVLSVSDHGQAEIWDAATGKIVATMPPIPPPPQQPGLVRMYYSAISRDGAYVAVPIPDGVVVWDGEHVRTIGPPRANLVAIDPTGARIAVGAGAKVSAWQVATGERLWTATLPARISKLGWTGDDVVALGADKMARVLAGGHVIPLPAQAPVENLSVGRAGTIATISGNVVELWDATGARGTVIDRRCEVAATAFSPDGRRIAVAGHNGIVRLYDTTTGAELGEFVGHRGSVNSIEFTRDGARLATAGFDLTVRIWDVADRREIVNLRGPREARRSPVGIVSARRDSIGKDGSPAPLRGGASV